MREIAGFFLDTYDLYHGFLRSPDGVITTFEAPGSGTAAGSYYGTVPGSINDFGVMSGYYIDAHGVDHGFLRAANAAFTTFDAPGAAPVPARERCPRTSTTLAGLPAT